MDTSYDSFCTLLIRARIGGHQFRKGDLKRVGASSVTEPYAGSIHARDKIGLYGIETVVRRLNLQEWCCLNLASQEVARSSGEGNPARVHVEIVGDPPPEILSLRQSSRAALSTGGEIPERQFQSLRQSCSFSANRIRFAYARLACDQSGGNPFSNSNVRFDPLAQKMQSSPRSQNPGLSAVRRISAPHAKRG